MSQLENGEFHASIKIIGELAEALETEPMEFLRLSPKRGKRGKPALPTTPQAHQLQQGIYYVL